MDKTESEVSLEMTYVINPYMGKEPFVYFSFAKSDSKRAMEIIDRMRNDGFRVWFRNDDIAMGSQWRTVFTERIPSCCVFVALASESYHSCDWCMEEYYYAREIDKSLIAITSARKTETVLTEAECFADDGDLFDKMYVAPKMNKCRSLVMDYSFISDIIEHVDDEIDKDEASVGMDVEKASLDREEFMRLEAGNRLEGEELLETWATVNLFDKCMLCALAYWNERILEDLACDSWYALNKSAVIFKTDSNGVVSFQEDLQEKLFRFYLKRFRKEMEDAIEIVIGHGIQAEMDKDMGLACEQTMLHYLGLEEGKRFYDDLYKALTDKMMEYGLAGDGESCARLQAALKSHKDKAKSLLVANMHVARHVVSLSNNDMEAALECLEEAMEIRQEILGENHPLVAKTHCHMARALRKAGEYEQALEHAEQAVSLLTESLGKDDPETLDAMHIVAEIRKPLGEPEESIQINASVLKKLQEMKDFENASKHASWKEYSLSGTYDSYVEEYFDHVGKDTGISPRNARIVNACMSIAQAHIELKEFPQALNALSLAKQSVLEEGKRKNLVFREMEDSLEAIPRKGMPA